MPVQGRNVEQDDPPLHALGRARTKLADGRSPSPVVVFTGIMVEEVPDRDEVQFLEERGPAGADALQVLKRGVQCCDWIITHIMAGRFWSAIEERRGRRPVACNR
jgi:hypothetical protein